MLNRIRDSKLRLHDIMLMLIVFLVPLVIGYHKVLLSPFELKLAASQSFVDVFNYWKVQVLFVLSLLGILSLMMDFLIIGKKRFDRRATISISLFALMAILAYFFSIDRVVAWRGILDRFEGVEAWTGYIIVLILAYDMMMFHGKERAVKCVSFAAMASAVVIGIIGLMQYYGIEVLNTDIVRYAIAPDVVAKADAHFFNETGQTFSTLSNPNYFGAYMSAMSLVALYYALDQRGIPKYVLLGIGGLSVFNMVVSQSSAGFLAFAITFPILIKIIFMENKTNQLGYVVSAIGIFLMLIFGKLTNFKFPTESFVIAGIFIALTATVILSHYKSFAVKKRSVLIVAAILVMGVAAWSVSYYMHSPNLSYNYLHDIRIDKSKLTMKWESGDVSVEIEEGNALQFKSGASMLSVDSKSTEKGWDEYTITEKDLSWLSFSVAHVKEFDTLKINPCGATFFIYKGNFYWVGINKEQTEISNTDFFGLKGFERLGSGRGYIWSRSIQQLPYSLLVGVGPDNFAFQFPQQDLLGKTNMGGTNLYIDKPHNMYLKLWIEFGLLGLISFLYLMLLSMRGLFLKVESSKGIMCAQMVGLVVLNFSFSSIFNDTLPSITPIMMAYIGLGLGMSAEDA